MGGTSGSLATGLTVVVGIIGELLFTHLFSRPSYSQQSTCFVMHAAFRTTSKYDGTSEKFAIFWSLRTTRMATLVSPLASCLSTSCAQWCANYLVVTPSSSCSQGLRFWVIWDSASDRQAADMKHFRECLTAAESWRVLTPMSTMGQQWGSCSSDVRSAVSSESSS